ncbi:MAG TPA: right-handed parallel beta-helix repeat-containing protein [archaeon]|nr:right-handed parallel beta-helix repeat-containing protein [archaeon]
MKARLLSISSIFISLTLLLCAGCCKSGKEGAAVPVPRTIAVAQSGAADVIGNDNKALQQAADMLRPGDTLIIGPGTYRLENSVVIPVSGVVVRGTPGETVLLKGPGVSSKVVDGGDWGESDLVVAEPGKFSPGMGVAMLDDRNQGGYNVVVGTVLTIDADTLRLSERSVNDLDYLDGNTRVENKFPLLCAFNARDIVIEDLTADGNKDENPTLLDGCRGGAFYLFNCRNCTLINCVARNYNGDGISFQIADSVKVIGCEAYGNAGYGVHPGTGSSRSEIRNSHFHHNGQVGFFLCYRVRYGVFSDNLIEQNGLYGISIGHKDTDNLFVNNTVRNNGFCGVYFRKNQIPVAGHRNVFRGNIIQDNGDARRGYGVYVEPHNQDLVFENNTVAETRPQDERTQRYGFYVVRGSSSVKLLNNTMEGHLVSDFLDQNAKGTD